MIAFFAYETQALRDLFFGQTMEQDRSFVLVSDQQSHEVGVVHLALDPEYAMQPGGIPGRRVGTLDAAQVNEAVELLARIVDQQNIPPKILVVHRFSQGMLTNYRQIKLDQRVQVVMNMDGFGPPQIKADAYKSFIALEPVQFTGFKLFYKKDRPMLPPESVLGLTPKPVYIQYQ